MQPTEREFQDAMAICNARVRNGEKASFPEALREVRGRVTGRQQYAARAPISGMNRDAIHNRALAIVNESLRISGQRMSYASAKELAEAEQFDAQSDAYRERYAAVSVPSVTSPEQMLRLVHQSAARFGVLLY